MLIKMLRDLKSITLQSLSAYMVTDDREKSVKDTRLEYSEKENKNITKEKNIIEETNQEMGEGELKWMEEILHSDH